MEEIKNAVREVKDPIKPIQSDAKRKSKLTTERDRQPKKMESCWNKWFS